MPRRRFRFCRRHSTWPAGRSWYQQGRPAAMRGDLLGCSNKPRTFPRPGDRHEEHLEFPVCYHRRSPKASRPEPPTDWRTNLQPTLRRDPVHVPPPEGTPTAHYSSAGAHTGTTTTKPPGPLRSIGRISALAASSWGFRWSALVAHPASRPAHSEACSLVPRM